MIRKPAFAGSFYPAAETELYSMVDYFLKEGSAEEKEAPGIMAPHAGYIYSGKVAGKTYASVCVPETVVILGPNHRGFGEKVSVMKRGAWEIPGGKVDIDEEMAELIISSSSLASDDSIAHQSEHSIEVQLPFIKRKNPGARIVPICLMGTDPSVSSDLARALCEAVERYSGEVLLVASSDMSHFISEEEARILDFEAIDKMKRLDGAGLLEVVGEKSISMCGVLPASAVVSASGKLKAQKGELIDYSTSAGATGDTSEVVAYAGMRFI